MSNVTGSCHEIKSKNDDCFSLNLSAIIEGYIPLGLAFNFSAVLAGMLNDTGCDDLSAL